MNSEHIHFWYCQIPGDLKGELRDFLQKDSGRVKKISEGRYAIDYWQGKQERIENINGAVHINEIEKDSTRLRTICGNIFSSEQLFIPEIVSCSDRGDYKLITEILQTNYGEKGKLTTGLFGIGLITGDRWVRK